MVILAMPSSLLEPTCSQCNSKDPSILVIGTSTYKAPLSRTTGRSCACQPTHFERTCTFLRLIFFFVMFFKLDFAAFMPPWAVAKAPVAPDCARAASCDGSIAASWIAKAPNATFFWAAAAVSCAKARADDPSAKAPDAAPSTPAVSAPAMPSSASPSSSAPY